MGCAAQTAKRRRKQAVNGYRHLPPKQRPGFKTHTKEVWERRAAAAEERRRALASRKRR